MARRASFATTPARWLAPLSQACKGDAERLCGYVRDLTFPGKVTACLREKKPELSGRCRARITRLQLDAAEDYRLDAQLYEACSSGHRDKSPLLAPSPSPLDTAENYRLDEQPYKARLLL